jgi:tetratricopeptide (TPR) repeat protein
VKQKFEVNVMKNKKLLWIILFSQFFAGIHIWAQSVREKEPPLDWRKTNHNVTAIITEQKMDIADLAAKVTADTPATAQDAMVKLNVLMRAGMIDEAIAALKELKTKCPEHGFYDAENIYSQAYKAHSSWKLAKSVIEVFANDIRDVDLEGHLLKDLLKSGWTVDKVDQWMAQLPPGKDNIWVKQRLWFNTRCGRDSLLLKELSDSAHKSPDNIARVISFLDVLVYARSAGKLKYDLTWIADIVKPKLSTEAHDIATRLADLGDYGTAVIFFRSAIDIPITDEEVRDIRMRSTAVFPDSTIRIWHAAGIRQGMSKCMIGLNRKDEAQKWMEEAESIYEKNGIPRYSLFDGEIQRETGGRTIENKIKEEEKKSENDPKYWRERASYYRGREDTTHEEEALKKALALAAPKTKEEYLSEKEYIYIRGDYISFLFRVGRKNEAVALLIKEIEIAPAESDAAKDAVHSIAYDFENYALPDNELLWNWLKNCLVWGYTEERLIRVMLQNSEESKLNKHLSRAEQLVRGKDPVNSLILGSVFHHMNLARRSIPLLKYAAIHTHDKEKKRYALYTLAESYLDLDDWKRAEEILPEALSRQEQKGLSDLYIRIGLVAAKTGNKTVAMRIWKTRANIDPSDLKYLEELADSGLKKELIAFYRQMQKKMPTSEVPARAFKLLE